MSPYLGTIAGYPVPIFALVLDAAVIAGVALAVHLARSRGVRASRFLDASLWTLAAALVGSRLWYAAAHSDEFLPNPWALFSLWEGGLALPGAVTAGALAALPAARWARVPTDVALGAGAAGLALAQGLGRLGCIPAGCAAGLPAESLPSGVPAVALPNATGVVMSRFPSQLVEAAGELALCFVLWQCWRAGRQPMTVAALYLMGYGLLRLSLEPLRGDSTHIAGVATASVWAGVSLVCGIAVLIRARSQTRAAPRLEASA